VQAGQRIQAGEFLGLVGNTGASTGPHLHFEIRVDGEYLDPFVWLKANAF
jgi:murein DD-endopeptidase MepM/ murein hydrolase activator NlpD